jgi:hypothetical protein
MQMLWFLYYIVHVSCCIELRILLKIDWKVHDVLLPKESSVQIDWLMKIWRMVISFNIPSIPFNLKVM